MILITSWFNQAFFETISEDLMFYCRHQVLRIKTRNEEEVKQLQLLESLEHLEVCRYHRGVF